MFSIPGDILACLAGAGGGALDIGLPVAECRVGRLDQLEDCLSAHNNGLRSVGEDGVTLQFMDGKKFFDLQADRFEKIREDLMGVIELGPRDK